MDLTKKIIILAVFFISTACVVVFTFSSDHGGEGEVSYKVEKLTITGWQEKSVVTSRAVLDTLQATRTIFSDYSQNGSSSVNLYIGYYDSLEKSKMSHAPQVCFTAQGWIMEENNKINIILNGVSRKINRLLLEKENEKLLVYYWYKAGSDIYADLFRMKLALLGKKLKQGKSADEGNAFIRISTSVSQVPESAPVVLQRFAEDLTGGLPKLFNNKEKLDTSSMKSGHGLLKN